LRVAELSYRFGFFNCKFYPESLKFSIVLSSMNCDTPDSEAEFGIARVNKHLVCTYLVRFEHVVFIVNFLVIRIIIIFAEYFDI